MSLAVHPAPCLVALVAWALAFTMASGASSPRFRGAGRERASRAAVARAGSQRPDDPRAWVAPDSEHDPEYTVADAVVDLACPASGTPPHASPLCEPASSIRLVAAPASSRLAFLSAAAPRLNGWLVRSAAGRAPPIA